MSDYYAAFAEGGFGLVITEGFYTDRAFSQGYLFQPGVSAKAQAAAWRSIVERVHAHGSPMIAQLIHAGALSQGNAYRADTKGPSALRPHGQQMAFYRGTGDYPMPTAMSVAEISEAVSGFARAAVLARESGFDGVEIHGTNGYLLDQFLTQGINRRDDRYGGMGARLTLLRPRTSNSQPSDQRRNVWRGSRPSAYAANARPCPSRSSIAAPASPMSF